MSEVQLIKVAGALKPANQIDAYVINKIGIGKLVHAKITQPRNAKFHRKFFALLNFGFEYYEIPEIEYKGQQAVKDFNRFREDVTILAGYYDVTADINGSVKLKARSISFAKMEEDDFGKLYSSVFNVIYGKILFKIKGMTEEVANNTLNEILSYD